MTIRFYKLIVICACLCLTIAAQANTIKIQRDTVKNGKLDIPLLRSMILERMDKDSIPAISIAVVLDGKILWEEGFGWADRENKIPATANTPFYLASITKSITTTALMLLLQRHVVDLDQPVNKYLGSAKVNSALWSTDLATVRRVATHTAGITTFDFRSYTDSYVPLPSAEYINRYAFLSRPPGERFDYSNLDYSILDQLISTVSGKSFGDFLKDEIFQPLNMKNASLGIKDRSNTAVSYSYQYGRRSVIHSLSAGASFGYASVHDLALFSMLHLKTLLPDQKAILSDALIDTLHSPQVNTNFTGQVRQYGLGWWSGENNYGYKIVMGQGGTDYSSSLLQLFPSEKIAIIGLSNKGSGALDPIANKIFTMLVPDAKEPPVKPIENIKRPPVSFTALTGTWTGIIKTYKGDSPLTFTIDSAGKIEAKLGAQSLSASKSINYNNSSKRMSVQLKGNLGTEEDTGDEPYDLDFGLDLRSNSLTGAVTTNPSSSLKRYAKLSYWVQLEKQN